MINCACMTNQGGRAYNEDTVAAFSKRKMHCFVLADGLGGHGHGKDASLYVSEIVKNMFLRDFDGSNVEEFIKEAFETAQKRLLEEQIRLNLTKSMKTTLVIAIVVKGKVTWGHIGDSRLYLFGKNKLLQRTRDHSVPQYLALNGEIEEKDIRFHPDRNVLLSVMGTEWEKPRYEINSKKVSMRNKSLLLCSDGFWEYINEDEMVQCLKRTRDVKDWLTIMKDIVSNNGKDQNADNYSAICVKG